MDKLAQYIPVTDPTWIFFIVLCVILFAPMLLERLRIPSVVGMIGAGVLIGPHASHLLARDASFELFGQVGLYYIMFLASLEMNMQDVQKIRGRALTMGLLAFALPMLLGFGANYWMLGCGVAASVLMAAMYASHTLVTYPIVLRYGLSRRSSVSIAVGGTIVADTLVLLVLAVVGGMFKEHVTGLYWLWLLLKVVALGLVIIYTFPRLGRWFFRRYDDAVAQFIFVLALVFLGAGLMEFVGIEGILGAFLVGIVLNRLIPPSSPLMIHLEFVGNALFIPYFLIGVGMIIDVQALLTHAGVLVMAAVMVVVALGGKWLAALGTQKIFGMNAWERRLMFGLSGSRAAATLAVVLVGHDILLPDGSRLLGDDVLNSAMVLILVTCVVSSFATEHAARHLALQKPQAEPAGGGADKDKLLIALSNPATVAPLVNMALMLRTPKSPIPLTGINIVLEDDPAARGEGAKALEHAVKIAAAAGVKMLTQSRWSVNVVSGISHAVKEYDASDLLVGLHRKTRLTDTFFGKLTADLLTAVERQVLVYRSDIPLNTVRRIHLLVPRKAEFEPGFAHWADSVALLAGQLSCRVDVYSGRDTLAALRAYWEARKYSTEATWNEQRDWRNLLPVAHRTRHDHMLVFVTARRSTLSYHSWIERLPEQVERHFSTRNVLIVFPTQYGAEGAAGSSVRSGLPVNIRTPHA